MASGLYWHVHHDVLWEWCTDYDGRVAYIKANKPAEEVETRLRLMQPVRDPPGRLAKAGAEYIKARAEYYKAGVECDKARAEYVKARAEYDKATAECAAEMKALHRTECPDCPWDGKTIFPEVKHG